MASKIGEHTHVKRNRIGKWYWQRVTGNGQVGSTSGQHFATRRNARRAALSAHPNLPLVADGWLPTQAPALYNHQ